MLGEVALGKVGLILSLEVSRISRGNSSGYHLLDICAVTDTLSGDGEGIYDPRSHNDRLLLGLKGTMSEAELHIMKQRLVEAVRAKAQRGAFRLVLPSGYFWDEAERIHKTPDEQVRTTLEWIFTRFEQLGTLHGVYVALLDEGIEIPVRGGRGGQVHWRLNEENTHTPISFPRSYALRGNTIPARCANINESEKVVYGYLRQPF